MKKNEFRVINNNIEEDPFSRVFKEFALELHAFGHQVKDAKNVCDFRVVGDFELIFVVEGKSLITIGQTEYELGRGDIILIPPFNRHKIQTTKEDPHDNYWIHFEVAPFFRQKEFVDMINRGICSYSKEMFEEILLPLLIQMEKEKKGSRFGSKCYLELLFTQIIVSLVRYDYEEKDYLDPIGRTSSEMEIVQKGMQFIQDHLEQPIKVKDISAHLHISESYLHKTFSRVMNLPPNYLIQLCKVKRGEQLLRTTAYSIKEISEMLCFSSQYYFSTVFKSFYGVSPRGFMEMSVGKQE